MSDQILEMEKKKKVYDQEMGVIKGDACVMGDNIFDYAFFMFD
jgi:hypothetical protein